MDLATSSFDDADANTYGGGFAELYEHAFNGWIRAFGPQLADYLTGLAPRRGLVLDLCCGTGETARALLGAGWRVVGIDRSPDMLAIAAAKHAAAIADGHVTLAQARAERFSRPERFDACICADGALNHLRDVAALRAAFDCVARVLVPGAPFILDLLEASHFARWSEAHVSEDTEHLVVRRGAWDPARNLACLTVSGGLGDASRRRVRQTLLSRTFTRADVEGALGAAGFEVMPCALVDPRPTGRAFYQARRADGQASAGTAS